MQTNLIPFNIELLILKDSDVNNIRPIKVADIFDGFSKNFHADGLFSTEIFGKVGEERRNRLFSYIDLKIAVFHPVIFKALCDLKSLYNGILSGKEYAVFNEEIKDFEKSDLINGSTGYSFFVNHFKKIKFEDRPSPKREFNIKLVNKYRENALLDKLVVMPAGLRDYVIDENGKPSEDEINPLYRKVLSISSIAHSVDINRNNAYLDNARYNLQIAVMEIYDYIKVMLEGKSKFVLGKWASRKIYNSTRNVITSAQANNNVLFDSKSVSTNNTSVGLYQYLRAILPLAIKHIRDTYLSLVFTGPNSPAVLINKTTLKKEVVNVDPEYYDEWMTYEGLEKVVARYGQENLRHEYLQIDGKYIGLIYKGPDNTFKFIQDIDEVPEGRSKNYVSPITFTELLYLSVYKDAPTIPCLVTRYPIAGYGSIYPSYVYLRSTTNSEVRKELNDMWEITENEANEFPIKDEKFFNSVSPSNPHIQRLVAD